MEVLMLCGVFAAENEQEVIAQAKRAVEFSANLFQEKLIRGFRETTCNLTILSAPFIGAFPMASRTLSFKGFAEQPDGYHYVPFNNIWGLRNLSRAASLKRAVRSFAEKTTDEKIILAYSAHTPFLEAAVYAKRKDPKIRICLMVPDLPEYMNLRADRSWIYDFAKKYDIKKMHALMAQVDGFILLTEQMKDALPVGRKPYRVVEGIIPAVPEPMETECQTELERYIVYTGKLDQAFGVRSLVDSMTHLDDSDYRLVLCGQGDSLDYAQAAARNDSRIMALGQVGPEEAARWQRKAAVLVNPRANVGEYTKYSFPSKNIEYLLTGKPVVAYMLDGMPRQYRDFMYVIDEMVPAEQAICAAIRRAVAADGVQCEKNTMFRRYAADKLCAAQIAKEIVNLLD